VVLSWKTSHLVELLSIIIRLQKGFDTIVVVSWKSSYLVKLQNIIIQIQKALGTIVVVVMDIFTFCKITKYYDTTSLWFCQKPLAPLWWLSWKSSHLIKSQNIMIRLQKEFDTIVFFVMEIFTSCKITKYYDTTSKKA